MSDRRLTPAVVLVADRTLSADYRVLFEGMFATMQTTATPELLMRRVLAPAVATDAFGRAKAVPLGLRRVQSALLACTPLGRDDVVCTTPEALPRLLGPWTRIVGVSSGDPLGAGMSNTTTVGFSGGELYSRLWTARMMDAIHRAKRENGFRVVFGGPGAWQWARQPDVARARGIDTLFDGYFESVGPKLFADLLDGAEPPQHVGHTDTAGEAIQPIRGASLLGGIELSRGCGRGCRFCTVAHKKMHHLPHETILSDLETNLAAGITTVLSGSEDLFRYGSAGVRPNFEALRNLLSRMKELPGLDFMQIDHGNVASVVQLTDGQLKEIRRLLTWRKRTDYLWVNMGVESANGRLLERISRGKIAPFRPEDWEDVVRQAADKMARAGFFCVFSVILGLPEETPEDVLSTLRLVRDLTAGPAVVFPVFYEPLPHETAVGAQRFSIEAMREDHLELFTTCYRANFDKIPRLYWDNQRAGGVSWLKRMLVQLLGRVETFSWRRNFLRVRRQIAARSEAGGPRRSRRQPRPAATGT